MTFKYRKEIIIIASSIILCFAMFMTIKAFFFKNVNINEPIKNVISYYNKDKKNVSITSS